MKNKVILYDAPKGFISASDYCVQINGKELFLYKTKVFFPPYRKVKTVPFGYFDCESKVIVKIKSTIKIQSVDIRPKSLGINASFDANSISFELDHPAKISVEINGSIENALLLFANPLEKFIPNPNESNVLYFGPGEHHAGIIELKSGSTLYLAGGAYVHGMVHTQDTNNVKICGRGILSAEGIKRDKYKQSVCLDIYKVKKFDLHGITILDSPNWSVRIFGCDDVDIENINIIGWRGNSDGIDVCGSRNVKVNNCFIRNNDDGLAVKAFNTGDVKDVLFSNCILWNDFARPIEVGYENMADHISNVHFKNIDIIHSLAGYPSIGIHEGDRAEIHDIFFENIRIEDVPGGQIFDLKIKPSVWNKDKKTGKIYSIHFKDIYLNGKPGFERLPENSRIQGYSNESTIEDVTLESVYILGKAVNTIEDLGLQCGEFTKNIKFISSKIPSEEQRVVPVQSKIEVVKMEDIDNSISKYLEIKVTLQNLSLEYKTKGDIWLDILPEVDCTFLDENGISFDLKSGEEVSKIFKIKLAPGKYFLTTQSDYVGLRRSWKLVEIQWDINSFSKSSVQDVEKYAIKLPSKSIYTYEGIKAGSISISSYKDNLILYARIYDDSIAGKIDNDSINKSLEDRGFSTENKPWKKSAIEIFATNTYESQVGDALFLLPETTFGRTTALINGANGAEIASELRTHLEVTYSFKNQPKVGKIAHIILQQSDNGNIEVLCGLKLGTEMGEDLPCINVGDYTTSVNKELIQKDEMTIKTEKTEYGYNLFAILPFELLSIEENARNLNVEMEVTTVLPRTNEYRAVSVFHSLNPKQCVQMFGKFYK